jgi:tetratricopeptide (TPR) repeat protein
MNAKSVLLSLLLLAPLPADAALDPFYQGLLRDGQLAFDRKEYAGAARTLRLACFGMLEDPLPLADCLARLALAQDGAGDAAGFRDTFQRLVEVEERFKGYSQGGLPPELRATLEARLATRIPAATLAGTPAFRSTLAKKPAAATTPPLPSSPSPPSSPPQTATVAAPSSAAPTSIPSAGAAPVKTGPPAPAPTTAADPPEPRPLSDGERKKLDQARQLLGAPRPSKDLRQAFELARSVADAHPDSKEAQHLAAEGAYRISRWSDATTYFRRGGDPGEEEPERLFYLAVSLYESGDAPAASAALKRSLPNLKRTPYVESYIHKILSQP